MTNVTITTTIDLVTAKRELAALQNQEANWETIKAQQLADLSARIAALQAAITAAGG
jgi:hypothetical protein